MNSLGVPTLRPLLPFFSLFYLFLFRFFFFCLLLLSLLIFSFDFSSSSFSFDFITLFFVLILILTSFSFFFFFLLFHNDFVCGMGGGAGIDLRHLKADQRPSLDGYEEIHVLMFTHKGTRGERLPDPEP